MTLPHVSEKAFAVQDASIWVSRLISQDEFHVAVKSWMEQQRETGVQFVSPALLLAEVGAAISRRTGDPALGDFEDAVILKTVGEVDSGLLSG
jgi:hypothetical protein